MRYALKDYQTDAVRDVLSHLARARRDTREYGDLVAFALSATTGAGKTVMATAVIEALFHGAEAFDADPDPGAVVLWVTDDPSLNEQTRYRMSEAGDRLDLSRLTIIENGFDQEALEPGNVYFLNVQKLASSSTWVRHSDKRTYTLWDTLRNTTEDDTLTLYLILDEAHRGMKHGKSENGASRSTIVQRIVNGHGDVPAAPIVWGISATVERFQNAMRAAQVQGRTTYPAVQVDARDVQESGLLKDTILLEFPAEDGAFETVLLRNAIQDMRDSSRLWAEYAAQEGMTDPVVPLMVLQVPNKPSKAELTRYLDVIHEEWPELDDDAVANVFGEHADLTLGEWTVPYIAPQHVQDATHIRVLLAKDAISTGWDCPRAEVLFSLRPARDRTYITQLLGRMVRTPLARRIESDERLNAVSCILPEFNRATATGVANVLTGEAIDTGDPGGGGEKGLGRKVLITPVEMLWNAAVPEEVADVLGSLPSEVTPKGTSKPIKRLLELAAELALDELVPAPNEAAKTALFAVLDGQMAQHRTAVDRGVEEIQTAEIQRLTSTLTGETERETSTTLVADARTIDDAYRRASRALGAALANAYVKRLALPEDKEDDEFDIYDAKAKTAALLAVPGVMERVEAEAENLTRDWLNRQRASIRGLTEDRQSVYDELRRQDREPQMIDIIVPKSRIENTEDSDGNRLPIREKHILADEQGAFPVGSLNDWELEVVDTELGRSETVAWYRNPSAAKADALQVPYRDGEKWKPMQPDFVVFTAKQDGNIGASIIDPHGHHLSDALPKLKGLARFAERYGNRFLRIEAISKLDDELKMLDIKEPSVRAAIEGANSAVALYRSGIAEQY